LTPFVWHDTTPRPAWQQMAIDRVLAERAARDSSCVYRLYRWERDALSFGANEAARRTWDRDRLERLELPSVRRPTGGRGVWHDRDDLTYAVTAPLVAFGSLPLAYRVIHEQLARAITRLGLAARLAPGSGRPTLAPGACFDLAVGGEVVVNDRKTIGSAQALLGGALLQHGAIALADRGAALARFRLESEITEPLIPADKPLPAPAIVADAILTTWLDEGGVPVPAELVNWAVEESARHREQYQDPAWTWRR
jgi:lipoyl(octanoyl) transferase